MEAIWAAVITAAGVALVSVLGTLFATRDRATQTSAAQRAETTAAEVKGRTDIVDLVIKGLQELNATLSRQVDHLQRRSDEQAVLLATCEADKLELRTEFAALRAEVDAQVRATTDVLRREATQVVEASGFDGAGSRRGDRDDPPVGGGVDPGAGERPPPAGGPATGEGTS